MRMVFNPPPDAERDALQRRFEEEIAEPLEMDHRFAESSERKRVAIMVSREDHCLSDLLWRWRSGELGADIAAVVSNHPDHAAPGRIAWAPLSPSSGRAGDPEASRGARAGAARRGVDLLVLARYMQILSGRLPPALGAPAINIHHSFLPAFVGADPYAPRPRARRQADRRHRPLRHR